jgi:hypothetical protein
MHIQVTPGGLDGGGSKDLFEKIAFPCKDVKKGCRKGRKHYHCKGCNVYTAFHSRRIELHYKKCWRRFSSTSIPAAFSDDLDVAEFIEQSHHPGSNRDAE